MTIFNLGLSKSHFQNMSCMSVDVVQVGLQSYRFKLKFVADIGGPSAETLLQSRNSFECNKIHLFQVIFNKTVVDTKNKRK